MSGYQSNDEFWSKESLTKFLQRQGIWTEDGVRNGYHYVLSPDVFHISRTLQALLKQIGAGVVSFQDGLTALDVCARNGNRNEHSLVNSLIKGSCGNLPRESGTRMPVCKVDVMLDQDGYPWIAEVDTYNPRGLLYLAVLREMREKRISEFQLYPGVVEYFLQSMLSRGAHKVLWVHAHKERYYTPWFKAFASLLKSRDIHLVVKNAVSLSSADVASADSIVMTPTRMDSVGELAAKELLVQTYLRRPETFWYPMVPWFESKVWMAFGTPGFAKDEYNSLVQQSPGLLALSAYIPQTVLVGKQFRNDVHIQSSNGPLILKAAISSGMKGVWMQDDRDYEAKLTEYSAARRPNAVLQRQIQQGTISMRSYRESGVVESDYYYVRLVVYVAADGSIVDVGVTARLTPDVHGAPDCLMLPCVLD
ncbi:MAG: hypothetical protein ACI9VM_000310 [Candidatus Azotimanducaceae bacterium]|jgi:hypothetical protein